MPDGRFLAKSIAHDWELNQVSIEADLLFERCIPHLDRDGRMPGHPAQVKSIALPLRSEYNNVIIDRCLGELMEAGLVRWYVADGRPCLEFPGFENNQRGMKYDREAPSKLPNSESEDTKELRAGVLIESGGGPAEVPPSESKLSESKLSESKLSEVGAARRSASDEAREWLGDHAEAVDRFLETLHGAARAFRGLWATYRPGGTAELLINEWAHLDPDQRPIVFAMSLDSYASDFTDWKSHLFRAVLKDKIRESRLEPGDEDRTVVRKGGFDADALDRDMDAALERQTGS